MALTKETIIDKLEVVGPHKIIGLREATVVSEDGVELARNFHRRVINPDEDISNETDEVKSVTNVVWTDEIKSSWASYKEANKGV
tara:strand:+ start:1143 stop:1397 length:255 start_codon:yes stop_codon:yes gene_type:complete